MSEEFTKEDILQAINEWPVDEQGVDYTDDTTARIHNPASVSSFFLRNVKKGDKTVSPRQHDVETEEDEVLADVALAKWWRKHGRHLISPACLPITDNPNTLISHLVGTEEGLEFIQNKIRLLRDKMSKGCRSVSVSSALSSFYEKIGNLGLAKLHLETVCDKAPHDNESRWRLLRLERAIQYRRKQEEILTSSDHNSTTRCRTQLPTPSQVERVSATDLSYSDFFYKYALTSTPVVITGLKGVLTSVPWTMQHIASLAGDCNATLKKSVKDSCEWARLESSKTVKIKDYIAHLHSNESHGGAGDNQPDDHLHNYQSQDKHHSNQLHSNQKNQLHSSQLHSNQNHLDSKPSDSNQNQLDSSQLHSNHSQNQLHSNQSPSNQCEDGDYLFDWSLPLHCQQLAQQLTIPKYFAGDFLQRTSTGSLYQDSWPSLFISPKGVTSELHVDAFGSNFWMALFQGKKRWTFFPREDTALLYPVYSHPWSSDPVFEADLDAPDMSQHPLLSHTSPVQCDLNPGEVLFVPAGCPHRVENLETSLAISANYVDLSNLPLVTGELTLTSLLDDRSHDLLKQLSDPDFPTSMTSDTDHTKWEKFKSWTKEKGYDQYDITLESVEKFRDK